MAVVSCAASPPPPSSSLASCRAGGRGRGAEADRKCTLEGLADTRKQIWMNRRRRRQFRRRHLKCHGSYSMVSRVASKNGRRRTRVTSLGTCRHVTRGDVVVRL